jgi:hypothetical protein
MMIELEQAHILLAASKLARIDIVLVE